MHFIGFLRGLGGYLAYPHWISEFKPHVGHKAYLKTNKQTKNRFRQGNVCKASIFTHENRE